MAPLRIDFAVNALPNEPRARSEALLVPAPPCTLREGLAWLGHGCSEDCPVAALGAGELPASVWFVRRGPRRRTGLAGRIVVDPRLSGRPAEAARQLISAVNACAGADGIEVGTRSGPGQMFRMTP